MKFRILALTLAFVTSINAWAVPPVEDGKTIFTSRCAGCHNVHKQLTGPALGGVEQRHSMEWIIRFVQGSQDMVKKGDKEALAIFEKFNKIPMPAHPDLTADNIKDVVAYIQAEAKAPPAAKKEVPPAKPEADYIGFSSGNYGLLLTYAGLLVLLIGSLLFLVQVKALRRRMDQEQV